MSNPENIKPVTDLSQLTAGVIVRHVSGHDGWVVTSNYGVRVTAVSTRDITNPSEWVIVENTSK